MIRNDARRAHVQKIRKEWSDRELKERERIEDLRRAGLRLAKFEQEFLLQVNQRKRRGAPDVLGQIHQFIANHFWWLHENGDRNVTKTVARKYGVSPDFVKKCAHNKKHKAAALEFVNMRKAAPVIHPRWAVEMVLGISAEAFRNFKK